MDINLGSIAGLGNASLSRQAAEIGREDARASSFQDELENALASGESAKMKEAARAFEAHFINMMFKQMRATIHHSGGIFERSQTEKPEPERSARGRPRGIYPEQVQFPGLGHAVFGHRLRRAQGRPGYTPARGRIPG